MVAAAYVAACVLWKGDKDRAQALTERLENAVDANEVLLCVVLLRAVGAECVVEFSERIGGRLRSAGLAQTPVNASTLHCEVCLLLIECLQFEQSLGRSMW